MSNNDESVLSIFVGLAIILIISGPLNAVIYAKTAGILWDWFLLKEYGSGPSTAAWFGISTIVGLLHIKKSYEFEGPILARAFLAIFIALFLCGLTLAAAWTTKAIVGW
jgi:hypothetical protein